MTVEVDVPNPSLNLTPGMFAETAIDLEQHDNAVTIPTQALLDIDDAPYVLTVENGIVAKRNVTVGIQGPDKVEILRGISAGEIVITSAQANYQAGERVRPQPVSVHLTEARGGR